LCAAVKIARTIVKLLVAVGMTHGVPRA
jgi:hypothetical protein